MPVQLFFFFGIFTLILGYVIGNFFPMLKQNPLAPSKDSIDKNTSDDEFLESIEELDLENPSPPSPVSPTEELLDVAHFWRTTDEKDLVAQIDDKLIYQDEDISGDNRALLNLLLLELGQWIGDQEQPQPEETAPSPSAEIARENTNEETSEEKSDGVKAPNFNPIEILKNAVMADVYLPLADISLADQIDPILQRLLRDSPLGDKGISLMDIEGRGMVVNVGLELYDLVEDVPDEEIKAIIREAVTKWEQAASGG